MLLEVDGLVKRYRTRDRKLVEAVREVRFGLGAGTILAFLGPNGAGKSTTIKMIAGLVAADGGDARVDGHSVIRSPRHALSRLGAVLEGSRNLYWRLTPLENFAYWGGIRGLSHREAERRGTELMRAFGLEHKLGSTVQQLSRGMQQQVAVCAALLHRPALLLLDEPTLGLDLEASDRIQSYVTRLAHEQGVAILLTTHQMEVADKLADRIAIIQNGELTLEDEKAAMLARFSADSYEVELGAPATDMVRAAMQTFRPDWQSDTVFRCLLNNGQSVYELLRRLEPHPVTRVMRETADLATVFRAHTRKDGGKEEATA